MMIYDKKTKGRQGEALVDSFFAQNRWSVYGKNIFFRGGEIDRIYYKNLLSPNAFETGISICLAEIKYTQVLSLCHIESIMTPAYLAKFIKPSQIRNLKKFGENLERIFARQNSNLYLYARLFLVIHSLVEFEWSPEILKHLPGKICFHSARHLILSLEPEMVYGKVTSSLQISVS